MEENEYILRPERGKDEQGNSFYEWVDSETGDIQYDWFGSGTATSAKRAARRKRAKERMKNKA